jgi:energy-coupling factor transport system substrate-specific component
VENADGGFGPSPGLPSSPAYSGWAALGLASAGHNPRDIRHAATSLLGYIQANVPGDPGSLERTILVARAAGVSASSFGGQDLVARLEHQIRANGSVGNQVNLTAFAVLALRGAGVAPPARSLAWLVRQQDRDGGFNFATAGGTSDVDDTGAAVQALSGAGGGASRARSRAVAFLRRQQGRDGGFPQQLDGPTNAQSTAWAVQGLIAAGVDPGSVRRSGGASPLAYLTGLIAPDGHVRYSRTSDQTPVWVTGQALMALAGKALPITPVATTAPASARNHHASPSRAAARASGSSAAAGHRGERKAARAGHNRAAAAPAGHATPSLHALAGYAAAAAALAFAPVGLS